jgi:integrase
MSLYKRGNVYWIEVNLPDGGRIRESTRTADQKVASEYHKLRLAQIKSGNVELKTWDAAVAKWMIDRAEKRSLDRDRICAAWLSQFFAGRPLATITDDEVSQALEQKRSETTASNANHYLAFIRALFNRAVEWKWIDRPILVKPYKVQNQRRRFLSEDEYARLMAVLPKHLAAMVEFSILTGLRKANVVGLKWDRIDLRRKILLVDAREFKSNKDFSAPLGERAIEILNSQLGKHEAYVFTYEGNPVKHVNNTAWRNALQKSGIKDFRWHDLRHTFASYHAMNGTPLSVLKALGGWETMEMVNRYAHLSQDLVKQFSHNSRVDTKVVGGK